MKKHNQKLWKLGLTWTLLTRILRPFKFQGLLNAFHWISDQNTKKSHCIHFWFAPLFWNLQETYLFQSLNLYLLLSDNLFRFLLGNDNNKVNIFFSITDRRNDKYFSLALSEVKVCYDHANNCLLKARLICKKKFFSINFPSTQGEEIMKSLKFLTLWTVICIEISKTDSDLNFSID